METDRRQFLVAAVAAPLLAARQAPRAVLDKGFGRVERLRENVYVTLADPAKGPGCLSNGGIITGRDASLIVEGHFQPAGAALELEAARLLSTHPIRGAVNTHFHFDHTFGNAGYAQERIPIIAHAQVPALMKHDYGALQGVDKASLLRPLEQRTANARTPEERQRRQDELAAVRWEYGAIDTVTLTCPTELLDPQSSPRHVDLGGLAAVLDTHRGHTPADVVITVPDRDVMFVGDLLFHRQYPVAVSADMIAWRTVLEALSRVGRSTRIVPGHGPVCSRDDVVPQLHLFDDLRQHAERMHGAGVPIDEAVERYVVPPAFRDYEVFAWSWTIGAAIQSYDRGLRKG